MKRRVKSKPDLDVFVDAANSAIGRAKKTSKKIGTLQVSRDFLDAFYNQNGITPIMICGLFYEIDENLTGTACYVEKLQ